MSKATDAPATLDMSLIVWTPVDLGAYLTVPEGVLMVSARHQTCASVTWAIKRTLASRADLYASRKSDEMYNK